MMHMLSFEYVVKILLLVKIKNNIVSSVFIVRSRFRFNLVNELVNSVIGCVDLAV